ncbi:hypothetical protein OIU79_010074 [Salix purpurea]|uniref:Uncharacterized protein n=1 Tax=Salix purpurea TaxID=77065 RepID=A0A9Q0QEW3_SALPP|nr:hypothetical protein OIU79_010074 [Salix purpurea]
MNAITQAQLLENNARTIIVMSEETVDGTFQAVSTLHKTSIFSLDSIS